MKFTRCSGILLHPTSLPGRFGIGDLGPEAFQFVDFLAQSGQRLWQVLPLGPTAYGDSPYQCFSAFAGNPLLINLEKLIDQELLTWEDLEGAPAFSPQQVDFGGVIRFKIPLLKKSYRNFRRKKMAAMGDEFEVFCRSQAAWLDDYALFRAVKEAHQGRMWTEWGRSIAWRETSALQAWSEKLADEILARKFWQFQLFRQWNELKQYCHGRGIRIMGDVPIFVAHDSADVWAHPEMFYLDTNGNPSAVAGVPPDYFSATGQRWGNPLYRWDVLAADGYSWWIHRLRAVLSMVDIVRLDHFRGFETYWEIPAAESTAVNGRWMKGPGAALFRAFQRSLGDLPLVAENLGMITPEVEQLKNQFDLPGMAVLQFAFGKDMQSHTFKPHNFPRHHVVYTGTHDNDTVVGWWNSLAAGDATRSLEERRRERDAARQYLNTDGSDIHWAFIRAVLASVADLAIIPLQDVLGLGNEARMNFPSRAAGNWRWRFTADVLTDAIRDRLRQMSLTYERCDAPPSNA